MGGGWQSDYSVSSISQKKKLREREIERALQQHYFTFKKELGALQSKCANQFYSFFWSSFVNQGYVHIVFY